MCGIAGLLGPGDGVESGPLDSMLDAIAHRGPDDRGTWTGGRVALGHVRLALLDPGARGRQPMVSADGNGVLAYNGEVYNWPELRRELEDAGVAFRSRTDAEVVLEALHAWGPEAAVPRFDGMFAFAYHDRRDGTLWLGRDRLGIKPLYLARTGRSVVFGSEVKALLAHPGVAARPDLHAIVTHLLHDRLDGDWTPFADVEPLVPGTLLRLGGSGETIRWFDVLRDVEPRRIVEGGKTTFPAALRRFDELLDESVERHMACDAPLATLCSGGLDSGLVTAAASALRPGLVAYVADIEGVQGEEANRAAAVCTHLGIELRRVPLGREAFLRLWPQSIRAGDQPNHFAQHIAALAVADAMARDGFKAVLGGDGADELFGGYPWYAHVHGMWRRRRRRAALLRILLPFAFLRRRLPRRTRLGFEEFPELPFAPLGHPGDSGISGPRIVAIDGARRHLRDAALFRALKDLPRAEERAFLARSYADLYGHLREALRANDRMAMARSVETRVPYLETALIDFALHLPCRMRYRRGVLKRLVHASALRRLPPAIVRRPKLGFRAPDTLWNDLSGLLSGGRLADLLRWSAADLPEVVRMVRGHPRLLYRVLSLELWARLYLDGRPADYLAEDLLRERRRAGS